MLMGPGSRVGRAASFPEIQAKPVISPEERPPLFLIYVELWNMERAPRLHRGEQGPEGSWHRLQACDKSLIATVSPGSLRPAMEHSLWRFITVKSLEALRFFFCLFVFYSPLLPCLQIRTSRRREGTSLLPQNHSTSGPAPDSPHLGTALVC